VSALTDTSLVALERGDFLGAINLHPRGVEAAAGVLAARDD
jgi:hypothetical protein